MKRIGYTILLLAVIILTGCATVPASGPPVAVDVSTSKLAVATHDDLLAAAKRATDNGFPSRATVWLAEDAKLTAIEAQISACANAIKADLSPSAPTGSTAGIFDAEEAITEAVGRFTGPSAQTKIICKPMPVVVLPLLPKP